MQHAMDIEDELGGGGGGQWPADEGGIRSTCPELIPSPAQAGLLSFITQETLLKL